MEILLYLLKSTALLSFFFLIYEFLLKRDTFFALNRLFLFSGIVAAAVLPLLTFTETVVVEENLFPVNALSQEALVSHSFPSEAMLVKNTSFWGSIDFTQIFIYFYLLGTIFFLIKFAISLVQLRSILNHRPHSYRKDGIRFIETDLKANPFTFFKTVVYNPTLHRQDELEMILHHERTHARNWHSLDILLGQLLVVFHWFNPLVWLYSARIDQNLEFIADYKTTENQFPKKSYQLSLLRTAMPDHFSLPVNNFYSFTKIRILMLNKNKSHSIHRLKVLLVLPFLVFFLMAFQTDTVTEFQSAHPTEQATDTLSNVDVGTLKIIVTNSNWGTDILFNGKMMNIKSVEPSLYRVHDVGYKKDGTQYIEAEKKEEYLPLDPREVPKGFYLNISDTAFTLLLFQGENEVISAFHIKRETNEYTKKAGSLDPDSQNAGPIAQINDVPKAPEETSVHENVTVEYKVQSTGKEHTIVQNGKEIRIDTLENGAVVEIKNGRAHSQIVSSEKHNSPNRIVSVQVFKEDGPKRAVAVDKDNNVIVLRFEIDENTPDADFEKVEAQFAQAGVDFKYPVVQRNRAGKITKIRMTLNNRKGTQAKVSNHNGGGIGTYTLGLNDNGSIYID